MSTHLRGLCFTLASLAATAATNADVYTFTVNSQASSLHDTINVSTPLTGSLIGSYDATTNPTGTQTRAGLFGGSGNNAIPTTGSLAAVDDSTTHPAGGFTLDVNTGRGLASISGLHLDYLNGQHPDILLNIAFQFATFHTVAPTALFIGNFPITLPLAEIAHVDTFSIEQTGLSVLGQLKPTGTAGQYTFSTLIPVRMTLAGSVLNNPLPTQPITILLPFTTTIALSSNGTATSTWSSQSAYNHVIPGPLFSVTDQVLDIPTIIPPGGTAHLLLNGDFGDLTIDLAATGTIVSNGVRQTTPCPADFNGDGHLNVLDFISFLNAYASGDPRGDFNGDGQRNALDFIAFLNAFAVGC